MGEGGREERRWGGVRRGGKGGGEVERRWSMGGRWGRSTCEGAGDEDFAAVDVVGFAEICHE